MRTDVEDWYFDHRKECKFPTPPSYRMNLDRPVDRSIRSISEVSQRAIARGRQDILDWDSENHEEFSSDTRKSDMGHNHYCFECSNEFERESERDAHLRQAHGWTDSRLIEAKGFGITA